MVVKGENGGRLWRFRKPEQSHDSGGCHGQLLDVAHGRSNTKKTVLRADYPDAVVRTDQSEKTGDPGGVGMRDADRPRRGCRRRAALARQNRRGVALSEAPAQERGGLGRPGLGRASGGQSMEPRQ